MQHLYSWVTPQARTHWTREIAVAEACQPEQQGDETEVSGHSQKSRGDVGSWD